MMMTIALRFIPTLIEEADKIMKAQMARGADFESGNLIQRAKAMVPLLVPLFVSAFRRAGRAGHGHGGALLSRRRGPHPAAGAALPEDRLAGLAGDGGGAACDHSVQKVESAMTQPAAPHQGLLPGGKAPGACDCQL